MLGAFSRVLVRVAFALPLFLSAFCLLLAVREDSALSQTILEAPGLAAFGTNTPPSGGGGGGTSYANTGGTGNRTAIIAVTSTGGGSILSGAPNFLVDGNTTGNGRGFFPTASISGAFIKFDFKAGHTALITEAKYYQQDSSAQGTWQWEGSNDNSTWTAIGSTFALGGTPTQTITTLSGNSTQYRYYRIHGISGNGNDTPWVYQFEFKISYT